MIDEAKIQTQIEPQIELAESALTVVTANSWLVLHDAHAEQINELLKEVQRRHKALEDDRVSFTKPLLDLKRRLDERFALGLEPLEKLKLALKNGLEDYRREREAARLESMRAAEKPLPPPVEVKGVTHRTERRFRVTDEAHVPRAFCSPDLRKIAAQPTNTPIDGVEWYDHTITTVRG